MAKNQNKTVETEVSVEDFLATVESESKRTDAYQIIGIMEELSGEKAKMWGPSIIGFGTYHYKYESGREGDMCRIGFSPRKAKHSFYVFPGATKFPDILERLGKYKVGKSCLYVNKMADIDEGVLRELITASLAHMDKEYPRE